MPINLPPEKIERLESGSGNVTIGSDGMMAREVELRYLVSEIENYTKAEEKGREIAPLYYDGHRRSGLSCRPVGSGWYEISATYGNTGIDGYEDFGVTNADGVKIIPVSISVDTTGSTETITQAYRPQAGKPGVSSYVNGEPGASAPESYGAINVSGGQVNGVSKTVPAFNFTETWLIPSGYLLWGLSEKKDEKAEEVDEGAGDPYAKILHEMTGTVNSDDFRIFKPGEVLFMGARYETNRQQTMVPVTFSFSVRPNLYDFYIQDALHISEKPGWHYMWLYYENAVADQKFPVKFPRYAYVDQIYEEKKFSDLKIGKSWSPAFAYKGEEFAHPLDPAKVGVV